MRAASRWALQTSVLLQAFGLRRCFGPCRRRATRFSIKRAAPGLSKQLLAYTTIGSCHWVPLLPRTPCFVVAHVRRIGFVSALSSERDRCLTDNRRRCAKDSPPRFYRSWSRCVKVGCFGRSFALSLRDVKFWVKNGGSVMFYTSRDGGVHPLSYRYR